MRRREERQTLNDGILTVYSVENEAGAGKMPQKRLKKKISLAYHERTVGMTRHWLARQAQTDIHLLLRTYERREVTDRDVVVLRDGKQYDIVQIQLIGGAQPPMMDLTLRRRSDLLKVGGLP